VILRAITLIVTLALGSVAAPLAAEAQQTAKVPRLTSLGRLLVRWALELDAGTPSP
jgi:hypothetical protein